VKHVGNHANCIMVMKQYSVLRADAVKHLNI